ncbi:MAG: AAA-associated domain-containing protein [Theionarchaea archaeon]|nr:AAA-associated domain-containing protein [Theionarchaea archaeon]
MNLKVLISGSDSIFDNYESDLKREMEQRFEEIDWRVKNYKHNKSVTTFLKGELEKRGLKFIGEDISLQNVNRRVCRPDLAFLCEDDFAILIEIKSSLPNHHDISRTEIQSIGQGEDEYFNMFVKEMQEKENCFEKLIDYVRHEIIFVVHDQDKHKFSEMVFPPNSRKELTFMLARDYNFQLWYWVFQRDKRDREIIKVEPLKRTQSSCQKLTQIPHLQTKSHGDFIYAMESVKFIHEKPVTEYTMAYLLTNLQGLIRKHTSEAEPDTYVWKSADDIHEIILVNHESLFGPIPKKGWIKEALEELVELGYVEKRHYKDDQYKIPLARRWAPKTIYEKFAEQQILKKYGLLKKRIMSRKRRSVEEFFIPNATYNQVKDIVLRVYESGGIITKDELKEKRNSADIHQEKNVACYLDLIEEKDGEILITKLGAKYAESDDSGQKGIFHDSANNKIPLYHFIFEKLSEERFLTKEQVCDEIQSRRDDPYSRKSIIAITNTIMNWLKTTGHCRYERRKKGYYFVQ